MPMNPRLLRPLATGFDPRRIANLAVWLDAADASSVTLNGGNASQWSDKSGGGNHLTQATAAAQPQYEIGGLNGKNCLLATGSEYMQFSGSGLDIARNTSGLTMFMVHEPSSFGAVNNIVCYLSINTSAASFRIGFQRNPVGGSNWQAGGRRLDANGFSGATFGIPTAGVRYLHAVVADYGNALLSVFENGTSAASVDPFQTAGNTSDTASSGAGVLAASNGSSAYFGRLAEVIVYRRALSVPERQQVERYLNAKWGIAVS